MFNSIRDKSILAGGATFALCLVAMLAGGLTWFTGAAGWCVFLAFVLSVFAGFAMWVQLNAAEAQQWKQERRDTIDRLNDAQKCIAAEERNHEGTKRERAELRAQLAQANNDASTAKREFENMRQRAAERGRTIDQLQTKISADNDQWRKQVSAVREAAYNMAVHIEGSANGLPDEWQEWGAELARDLRALAGAAGVENDNRQVTIDEALAEPAAIAPIDTVNADAWATPAQTLDRMQAAAFEAVPLPAAQTQPTPLHAVHALMAKVRANQAQRRANLDKMLSAVGRGYELSAAIMIAYNRGALWVSDELIANECQYIDHWTPSE